MTQYTELKVWYGVDKAGEVTAFIFDNDAKRGYITCYAHIGQHSEASWAYYLENRAATKEERANLEKEIKRIYDYSREPVITKTLERRPRKF